MSNHENDGVPDEIALAARNISLELLPPKSKQRYVAQYNAFKAWRKTKCDSNLFSEDLLLVYFDELSKNLLPPTLLSRFSMIKACIKTFDNINIGIYLRLLAFLKRYSANYVPKKSKVLTADDIAKYCNEADDSDCLVTKVVCIIGILGGLRREELTNLLLENVEDHNTMFLIKIPKTKTGIQRSFTVVGEFYKFCKNYLTIRSEIESSNRLFLKMHEGRCTNLPLGINTIGAIPKKIATFLQLPEPELYTGHCFRRTSATLLVDGGGKDNLERHGGWKSDTIAEG